MGTSLITNWFSRLAPRKRNEYQQKQRESRALRRWMSNMGIRRHTIYYLFGCSSFLRSFPPDTLNVCLWNCLYLYKCITTQRNEGTRCCYNDSWDRLCILSLSHTHSLYLYHSLPFSLCFFLGYSHGLYDGWLGAAQYLFHCFPYPPNDANLYMKS